MALYVAGMPRVNIELADGQSAFDEGLLSIPR